MNKNCTINYSKDHFNSFISKVFAWMFLGLLITTFFSFVTNYSFINIPSVKNLIINNSWIIFTVLILEIIVVFLMSFKLTSFSYNKLKTLFIFYSVLNGFSFGLLFTAYSTITIYQAFLTASISFGVMSIYGLTTNKDLTKLGSFLIMSLIGIIILSLINVFIGSSSMEWALCIAGLFIFLGITAYDIQKLKYTFNNYTNYTAEYDDNLLNKAIIIGALSLYLDFINIFIRLLNIFSKRD